MIKRLLILMIAFLAAGSVTLQASEAAPADSSKAINPKEIIFEHLGDAYGWEVPFSHEKRIPLPIIVFGKDGGIHCFSSSRVAHGATYTDGDATFKIGGHDSKYKGKLVEIVNGEEFRPLDFSITKNVAGIFITAILVVLSEGRPCLLPMYLPSLWKLLRPAAEVPSLVLKLTSLGSQHILKNSSDI